MSSARSSIADKCAIKVSVDGNPPFTRARADPRSAGSTLIRRSEKIFNGCDSIQTVEIMRNPKHGGTALEPGGSRLDGELF